MGGAFGWMTGPSSGAAGGSAIPSTCWFSSDIAFQLTPGANLRATFLVFANRDAGTYRPGWAGNRWTGRVCGGWRRVICRQAVVLAGFPANSHPVQAVLAAVYPAQ